MKRNRHSANFAASLALGIAALIFATAAVAQTEKVLYSFGGPDGAGP